MSADHDDFAVEPVPGLPAALPAGETLLWQGAPRWTAVAIDVLHVRKVAIYFALLGAWELGWHLQDGIAVAVALASIIPTLLAGAAAIAVLLVLARAIARSSVYTITSARVVLRVGVALPIAINIPLRLIRSLGLRKRAGGRGDLRLQLEPGVRLSYVALWPHLRTWRIGNPEPLLRCLDEVAAVGTLLCTALGGVTAAAPSAATSARSADDGLGAVAGPDPGRAAVGAAA